MVDNTSEVNNSNITNNTPATSPWNKVSMIFERQGVQEVIKTNVSLESNIESMDSLIEKANQIEAKLRK